MRGQVILVTALVIALAISAVLILQSAAVSAPGFGGVRAAYGVFSRDVAKAVDAVASYVDYVGTISLLNFTENAAAYGLPAAGLDTYCSWLHINKTADMVNASMKFFVANRAALGLSAEMPTWLRRPNCRSILFKSTNGLTVVNITLPKLPNGTVFRTPLPPYVVAAWHIDRGILRPISSFAIILPNRTYMASYSLSMVMNISLLALVNLNITRSLSVGVKVLGVDSQCTPDVVCVNITVSRPYTWAAKFIALNRTMYLQDGWTINYTVAYPRVDVVNYTERSAVYSINTQGLNEYVLKAYVGGIPLYVPPRDFTYVCKSGVLSNGKPWSSLNNPSHIPIVLYNFTNSAVVSKFNTIYANVTIVDVKIRDASITYWVIHRNGYLNFTENICSNVKGILQSYGLYWLYP